jgi:hypothetical protein
MAMEMPNSRRDLNWAPTISIGNHVVVLADIETIVAATPRVTLLPGWRLHRNVRDSLREQIDNSDRLPVTSILAENAHASER